MFCFHGVKNNKYFCLVERGACQREIGGRSRESCFEANARGKAEGEGEGGCSLLRSAESGSSHDS